MTEETISPSLHSGDCREVLKTFHAASIDSVVTDPPYHLTQISRGGSVRTNNPETPFSRTRLGDKGFMGKTWDGGDIAFDPAIWTECLRVLKPGGHLLAFGGSRTYHRLASAIEDAGFEIRDQIMWVYGSGFPKSHNLIGEWEGWGTALKPAHEPIVIARKPLISTVAENVAIHGTGALNIDGCRVKPTGESRERIDEKSQDRRYTESGGTNFAVTPGIRGGDPAGRWPANFIHDGSEEVLAAFPDAPGQSGSVSGEEPSSKTNNVYGQFDGRPATQPRGDRGSAARFFYCAKASRKDRGDGNTHPTVKPTDLMRYLCRLVTPPSGVILDPFLGSGSTGVAARCEGFDFIGIEREPEYFEFAKARIEAASRQGELPLIPAP